MMRKILGVVAGSAMLLMGAVSARATVLVADFNDIASGGINGKGGGTGFTGSWSGSANGTIVATDLTSPLYTVQQAPGTAQHYRSANNTGLRQNFRNTAASPTGTVWFSFLAMAEATGDRAGVSFNPPTASPFNDTGTTFVDIIGNTLNWQFGASATPGSTAANAVGQTNLIVGQFIITGSGGNDSVKLWLNPDLVANPDINTYTPVYNSSSFNALDAITTLGAIAARADTASSGGGNVDNIRISDGGGDPNLAYKDVTVFPEPASLGLIALSGTGLLRRSRRSKLSK